MLLINRFLSDANLNRFLKGFRNPIKIVNNSKGELDIAIRTNYLNIYYKGNSLAKIGFKGADKYEVTIHKKFFNKTAANDIQFYDKKCESDAYVTLTLSPSKPPLRFFKKKHINQFCSEIKKVNYGEEIVFEQALITDNLERSDFIIIDRQITDKTLKRKRMDLLALKQIKSNIYNFVVIEVKLGNNPELKSDVTTQLTTYTEHIEKYFDDYKGCYEIQYAQKKQMGFINTPSFNSINIEKPVEGVVVVGGYSRLAQSSIEVLKKQFPHLHVKQFQYKL